MTCTNPVISVNFSTQTVYYFFGYNKITFYLRHTNKARFIFRYLTFLSCTGLMFIISMVAVILFYKFFVRSADCKTNLFFVSFSLCQSVAVTVVSVLPKVQEAQSGTGEWHMVKKVRGQTACDQQQRSDKQRQWLCLIKLAVVYVSMVLIFIYTRGYRCKNKKAEVFGFGVNC